MGVDDFYYPSCVVNLRLRFDESYRIVDLPLPGPQGGDPKSAVVPASTGPRRPTATIGKGWTEKDGGRYMSGTRPLITQRGNDALSYVQDRVPKSASVELPSYRQAGKFSLEFDWRELPIDPRLVRSCGVEIFFGTVDPGDFATGMIKVDSSGRRRSVMATTGSDGSSRDDLMALAGVVDNWSTTHNDQGGIVKMDGRDLRGIFLDSPVSPELAAKLDLTQSLDLLIVEILASHPAGAFMTVTYAEQDWPGGSPPSVLDKDGLTRVRREASGQGAASTGAGGGGGDDKFSMWDMITRYSFLVGAVPYFRGRQLVIRPALSVFDQSKPKFSSSDVVFNPTTRVDDDGVAFTTRKMVLGRNIKELSFERKLSGVKVPVIEVVSFDTSSTERGAKKLLIEQWPPADAETARITGVHPSGEVSQEDKKRISVPGIRDREKLLGIARAIWEEVGRGELGGNCSTGHLSSFKGSNADPDLLRLRPGDVVEFLTDTRQVGNKAPGASTYIDSTRVPFDEAVAQLQATLASGSQRGDENLARVIVASSRSQIVDLLRSFRVANVSFSWSLSQGIQVKFDFQNYFVIRYGINDQLGANVIPPVETKVNSSTARREKVRVVNKPVIAHKPTASIGKARRGL